MKRKTMLLTAMAASMAVATPALAWGGGWGGGHSSSGGGHSSSGGSHSSSGGSTQVPEPGVLGLMGAGLIGLGLARRRKSRD